MKAEDQPELKGFLCLVDKGQMFCKNEILIKCYFQCFPLDSNKCYLINRRS